MGWEARNPVPPPEAATFTTDPRIEEARVAAEMLDLLNPDVKAIHYEAPDGRTECVTLLAQDFKSLQLSIVADVPAYDDWLLGCDQTSAYEHHHLVLKLLQSPRARPVVAEVPAPLDRAGRAPDPVPGRAPRRHAPRPGPGRRIALQLRQRP